MALTVAIQMDHVSSIDINGDSTFVMALEAQKRGHKLLHYLPGDLAYQHGRVTAWAEPWPGHLLTWDHESSSPTGIPTVWNRRPVG